MRFGATMLVLLLLTACAAHSVRCDAHLTPINRMVRRLPAAATRSPMPERRR
ncbi:MAG TPA: hypothetical protein VMU86_03940 [Steroidobacteraceae bacterium]|nr:hypothetical protein [Steroidobacteraceae bacterium]